MGKNRTYHSLKGIYIHFPFCKHRCPYCKFFSLVNKEELIDKYIDALKTEIFKRSMHSRELFSTLYIGGGTPSLMKKEHIKSIVSTILTVFRTSFKEVTIELNPEHNSLNYLKDLVNMGINRLSIGAQSFFQNELNILGRLHSPQDIYKTYENARKAGFKNINIDLIFGYKGLNNSIWLKTLKKVLQLQPEHISTYGLSPRKYPEASDENTYIYQMNVAIETLQSAGYKHYEVSNFSKEGYASLHNLIYWHRDEYLGFGASAASFYLNYRFITTANMKKYLVAPERKNSIEYITEEKSLIESIYMNLRLFKPIKYVSNTLIDMGYFTPEEKGFRISTKGLPLIDYLTLEIINNIKKRRNNGLYLKVA